MNSSRLSLYAASARSTIMRALGLSDYAYSAATLATVRVLYQCGKAVGWDDETCAAFLGNTEGECSFELHAWGDHEMATDIEQDWPYRRSLIFDNTGIDMTTAGAQQQFAGIHWEMTTAPSPYRGVNALLVAAVGVPAKVTVLVVREEQSASQASDVAKRTAYAQYWLARIQAEDWGAAVAPKPAPSPVAPPVAPVAPAPPAPAPAPTPTPPTPTPPTVVTLPPYVWKPSPNFNEGRAGSEIERIVIHDCQGGYAGSIATFLSANGGNPVSAHLVLREDGGEVTQMVRAADKAWAVVQYNRTTYSIEMAGFEAQGYSQAEWGACEALTSYFCKKFGIPAVWAPNDGQRGICRHYDLGWRGGSHTDPTLDMTVWSRFISTVASIVATGDVPASWSDV